MAKKLIEVALPLAAINDASSREKSIRHGHPSTLHLWWARRPLAAARAVIWASLVDDPSSNPNLSDVEQHDERQRLFKILENLVIWENSNNPDVLAAARAEIDRCFPDGPPPVLDPFGGGGAIPLEAQRLGLTALSGDLNPVAVLIQKAMIEIPPRFANRPPVHPDLRNELNTWTGAQGLAADVEAYGQWMRDEAEQRIGHLYPNVTGPNGESLTPIAWIWARTVKSPDPSWNGHVPLVASWILSKKPKKPTVWIEPIIDHDTQTISYEIREGGTPTVERTVDRGNGTCIATGAAIPGEYIKNEGREGRLGHSLIAVVALSDAGRVFLPAATDRSPSRLEMTASRVPRGEMSQHPQYMGPPRYGMNRWAQMFTNRQLVAMCTLSDLISEAKSRVAADAKTGTEDDHDLPLREGGTGPLAYSEAVATYLAFGVNRFADINNSMARWEPIAQCPRQLFGRQSVSMVWDFAEANPLGSSSGSFVTSLNGTVKGLLSIGSHKHNGAHSTQRDARARVRENPGVVVSTDPPYYDSVPYADISDFFYVWLRRNLSDVWPDETSTLLTPKHDELVADSQRHGSRQQAADFFESGMAEFMAEVRANHHPDVPSTIYYAFKATEVKNGEVTSTGWSTFLQAIIDAGLTVTATWPMRTENSSRLRAQGSNALASSIVLTCRPREETAALANRREFIATLRNELPNAVRVLQSGNIAPVDLAQSTIGPGIGIFSRYAKVVESDGNEMSVATALNIINDVLGEILDGEESEMDADSRFALAWYSQHGYNPGQSGDAISLAQAKNTSPQGVVDAGIANMTGGKFRLLERSELDTDWDPVTDDRRTVWESTQYLVAALHRSESEAADLIRRLGAYSDNARTLAYLLFKKATDKGWAEEAGAYNELVTSWPDLTRLSTPDVDMRLEL